MIKPKSNGRVGASAALVERMFRGAADMTDDEMVEAMARAMCFRNGTSQCAAICLTRFASDNRQGRCSDAIRVHGENARAAFIAIKPTLARLVAQNEALAAERDAALKQVREPCLQFLADQGQEIDAALAAKPAAPTGETVRVRIAVWCGPDGVEEMLLPEHMKDGERPDAWITADIPIPQAAEVAGTVEVSDAV